MSHKTCVQCICHAVQMPCAALSQVLRYVPYELHNISLHAESAAFTSMSWPAALRFFAAPLIVGDHCKAAVTSHTWCYHTDMALIHSPLLSFDQYDAHLCMDNCCQGHTLNVSAWKDSCAVVLYKLWVAHDGQVIIAVCRCVSMSTSCTATSSQGRIQREPV